MQLEKAILFSITMILRFTGSKVSYRTDVKILFRQQSVALRANGIILVVVVAAGP